MSYCYSPIDSPDFLYAAGDCEIVKHDLTVENGGLADGDLSAVLIQLGTDRRQDDKRGWWGDEFQPFPLGNRAWAIAGTVGQDLPAKLDEVIREALDPLIDSGVINSYDLRTVQTINGQEIDLTLRRGSETVAKALLNG